MANKPNTARPSATAPATNEPVAKAEKSTAYKQTHTDLSHAEAFLELNRENIRFCPPAKQWLLWNDRKGCWEADLKLGIIGIAKDTVAHYIGQALHQNAESALKGWTARSFRNRFEAMIDMARNEVAVLPNELDTDPNLLCVRNGTIDLATGTIRASKREDLITKQADVIYDENATAPRWEKFLEEVFAGNQEIISYVQRAVGYTLTGETTEQCFFVCEGVGANGKSVFSETIQALLGDYAVDSPFETFIQRDRSGVPNDIARLVGARMVLASEGNEGQKLDEARIKLITGGDAVTARFLNKEYFTFHPACKIWLRTNHLPVVSGTNEGIWRRIKRIPFDVQFAREQWDENLKEKLIGSGQYPGELSGILNWALEGLAEWRRIGLAQPEQISAAVRDYREDMDDVTGFLRDCCDGWEVGKENPNGRVRQMDLYAAYQAWCENNGKRAWTQMTFSTRMKTRAKTLGTFEQRHTNKGKVWEGLELKPEAIPTPF